MSLQVAVTGLGAVSVFGDSVAAFRDGLLQGRTGMRVVSGFDARACRSHVAAEVQGFDAAAWIAPMKLRRLDPTSAMATVAVRQALEHAGLDVGTDGDDRTGIVLGSWSTGGATTSTFLRAVFDGGPSNAPAILFSATVGNSAASHAALEFKLRGPNLTISQKEASGLGAVVTGTGLLRTGRTDRVVAAGVDHVYEIFYKVHDWFEVMPAGAPPEAASRPFDHDGAGFVLGEGGFALLLQTAEATDPPLGRVLGVGAGSVPAGINAWPTDPDAIVRVMQRALDDAGCASADVGVVYAAANGAPAMDAVEARALATLFEPHQPVVTSIKGAIGESGAAGVASCVAALACGAEGLVPPAAGLRVLMSEASSLQVATRPTTAPGPVVLVNSIASGGALFSVVLEAGGPRGAS